MFYCVFYFTCDRSFNTAPGPSVSVRSRLQRGRRTSIAREYLLVNGNLVASLQPPSSQPQHWTTCCRAARNSKHLGPTNLESCGGEKQKARFWWRKRTTNLERSSGSCDVCLSGCLYSISGWKHISLEKSFPGYCLDVKYLSWTLIDLFQFNGLSSSPYQSSHLKIRIERMHIVYKFSLVLLVRLSTSVPFVFCR